MNIRLHRILEAPTKVIKPSVGDRVFRIPPSQADSTLQHLVFSSPQRLRCLVQTLRRVLRLSGQMLSDRAMTWVIRRAVGRDAAALSELAERTFREAFSALNSPENMDLHCATAYSTEVQAEEIANPEIYTVVAESHDLLVAFAQLHLRANTPSCISESPSVELHRIYVEQAFHGTGLASDLMDDVLNTARKHGAAAIWLGVWEHNPRAIRFYQRFGFSEAGDHVFTVGRDPQHDLVLVCKLIEGDGPA